MPDLHGSFVIDTQPFPATLLRRVEYHLDWLNKTTQTYRIWRAQVWFGMDIGGRGDLWGVLTRISDGTVLAATNWDRYAEPTALHNLTEDYTPNYFDVSPGDGLRLFYGCRAFAPWRILVIAFTLGLLPMRGHESVVIWYTLEAT